MRTVALSHKFFLKIIFVTVLVFSFLFLPKTSHAYTSINPANGGTVSFDSCGEISSAGTYDLTGNINANSGQGRDASTCLTITSNDVIIENGPGGPFTITGKIDGSGQGNEISGYPFMGSSFTVSGIHVNGNVLSNGETDVTTGNAYGGGNITINGSAIVIGTVTSTGGTGGFNKGDFGYTSASNGFVGADGGSITITDSTVGDISSTGGADSPSYFTDIPNSDPGFILTYGNIVPGSTQGTDTVDGWPVHDDGNGNLYKSDSIYAGHINYATGEISDDQGIGISSISYEYSVSSSNNSGNGGEIDISGSTVGDISSVGGSASEGQGGNSGLININNSATGNVTSTGGSGDMHDLGNGSVGSNAGSSGDIDIAGNSTITGSVTSTGGSGDDSGGTSGLVNVTDSEVTGSVSSNGGGSFYSNGNNSGVVTIDNSKTGDVSTSGGGGANDVNIFCGSNFYGNGGNAGEIDVVNGSIVTGTVSSGGGNTVDCQGYGIGNGGVGGQVTVTDSVVTSTVSSGGGSGGAGNTDSAGSGGVVNITNSQTKEVSSGGGSTYNNGGADGGAIYIASSTITGAVHSDGGDGYNNSGGNGGGISITANSIVSNSVSSSGGNSTNGNAGNGGSINIANSSTGEVSSIGSDGYGGGSGEEIDISFSSITGNVSSGGGANASSGGSGGSGGLINIGNSRITGSVSSTGGTDNDATGSGGSSDINITNSVTGGAVSSEAGSGLGGIGGISGSVNIASSTINGNITSVGGTDDQESGGSGNVSIISGSNVYGTVSSVGGSNNFSGDGSVAGKITIIDSTTTGAVSSTGGTGSHLNGDESGFDGNGGGGGLISIASSTINGAVTSAGNNAGGVGGSGGEIDITANSIINGIVYSNGGNSKDAFSGGAGGTTNITDSTVEGVSSTGGDGSGGYGGSGGAVNVTNSRILGSITSDGSNGDQTAGNGGDISIISGSTITGDIYTGGGGTYDSSAGGNGGSITIVDSVTGTGSIVEHISSIGGSGEIGSSGYGGNGGDISITSSGILDLSTTTVSAAGGSDTCDGGCGGLGTNGTLTLSYNGSVTNGSTIFNNVLNLIVNGVDYGPWNTVFNPNVYYFTNAADTNWNNLNNWWTKPSFTGPHPSSLPTNIDQVFINGVIGSNSGNQAVAGSIIFNGNSSNAISIISRGTIFNDSSSNTGNITSNSTKFYGDNTSTSGGTISTYVDVSEDINQKSSPIQLAHGNIVPGSITGTDGSDLGIIQEVQQDSTYGNIYSVQSGGLLGTIDYVSGILTYGVDESPGTILKINYRYNIGSSTIQRIYNSNATTTRNFTQEGYRDDWMIIANNAIVNISNAVYNTAKNIFEALANSSFITGNNTGGQVVPNIVIATSTLSYTGDPSTKTIKWLPSIDWDTSVTCEYSYDNWKTSNPITCSHTDTTLPRPNGNDANISRTLYLRGIDANGNMSEKSLTYFYDNTSPVWTSCGSDQMNEPTRPYYYLKAPVVGDCTIDLNNTELRGNGFSVTGNIISAGYNVILKNIVVSGTVSSSNSSGNAGNITIASSTIGDAITANGAANYNYGYNGGTITISNSITKSISSLGGGGSCYYPGCAFGGYGNVINIASSTVAGTITSAGGYGVGRDGFDGGINITANSVINGDIYSGLGNNGDQSSLTSVQYSSVTGTVSAKGGDVLVKNSIVNTVIADGLSGINNGNGNNITIATSTTGVVSANGADMANNGGNGGTINITYSAANASSTVVSSIGGNSTSCGYGGSGGDINIINSIDYTKSNTAGSDHSGGCTRNGHSGYSGGGKTIITDPDNPYPGYVPPTSYVPVVTPTLTPTIIPSSGVSTYTPLFTPIYIPVNSIKPIALKNLPVFGSTAKNSFSFTNVIGGFISAPLSDLSKNLKADKQLTKYFASVGLATQQDLLDTRTKPIPLPIPAKNADIPDGLIMLSSNNISIPLTASYDNVNSLSERATVTPSSSLTISLFPTTKGVITATFNDHVYTFQKAGKTSLLSINLTAPTATSTFAFSTVASPVTLLITVAPAPQTNITPATNQSLLKKFKTEGVWKVLKFW